MNYAVKTTQKAIRYIVFSMVGLSITASAQRPHTLTGTFREHKAFHSSVLNNDRNIIIYLPPDYETNLHKRYPVMYFHDGQNLFDGATSFIPGKEWQLDETAQSLISAGKIEPLIIVGINNTGKDRIDEYTPVRDAQRKMGGRADSYGRFLVEELKPFIDANYRTIRDARHTGLGGSSLGGLVSLYLGLKYPAIFGRLAIVSPSVWFADKQIISYVNSLTGKPDIRVWIDMGTKEGNNDEDAERTVADARLLKDRLLNKGWREGKDLKYFEAAGAEHNESAWAERVGPMLTFLFPGTM